MASQNQNNNNNNVSDVITQAHDCLRGSYTEPSTSANVSQPNVNNQQKTTIQTIFSRTHSPSTCPVRHALIVTDYNVRI
jgi:hypothetical protein